MTRVQKVMLDTNQYDKLLVAPEMYNTLLKGLSQKKIELLTTHIQRDEILAIGDDSRKARLEAILAHASLVATRGIVVGLSRLDLSRFGNDENHHLIEHIRGDAWERKSEDALIAATAAKDSDLFVTEDKRLAKRLRNYPGLKCQVIDFEEFERRLTSWSF